MTVGKRAQSARIYHETQTAHMCALHAINNLLQDAEFTANDLVRIGHELDKHERALYGSISGDVNDSLESWNLDPSGNFSIQVMIVALALYGLELVSLNSSDPRAIAAAQNTYNQQAFVCHKDDHWFTIRKFGSKWYNLDSLLRYPKRLSDNAIHLSLFATRELTDSYTGIFVVMGNLQNANMNEPDESDDPDRNYVDSVKILPTSHNQKPQPTPHGDQGNDTDRNRTNRESKWRQLVIILQKLFHGEGKS